MHGVCSFQGGAQPLSFFQEGLGMKTGKFQRLSSNCGRQSYTRDWRPWSPLPQVIQALPGVYSDARCQSWSQMPEESWGIWVNRYCHSCTGPPIQASVSGCADVHCTRATRLRGCISLCWCHRLVSLLKSFLADGIVVTFSNKISVLAQFCVIGKLISAVFVLQSKLSVSIYWRCSLITLTSPLRTAFLI